jgi:hypothetical protein
MKIARAWLSGHRHEPFPWDVRASSKDHTVTASTSATTPATTARYTTMRGLHCDQIAAVVSNCSPPEATKRPPASTRRSTTRSCTTATRALRQPRSLVVDRDGPPALRLVIEVDHRAQSKLLRGLRTLAFEPAGTPPAAASCERLRGTGARESYSLASGSDLSYVGIQRTENPIHRQIGGYNVHMRSDV